MKLGKVISILGQNIQVLADKKEYICLLKGSLKKEKGPFKTLVAVGDLVTFNPEDGLIHKIEKRSSILSRKDPIRKKEHIIATNIDQVLITTSVISPPLKPYLVDRYIYAAQKGNMQPIIIINKIDLLKDKAINEDIRKKEKRRYQEFLSAYEKTNIPIFSTSAEKKIGIKALLKLMKNKASVFSGQSGVGKSSLINLVTKAKLEIAGLTKKTKKGTHTTTKAELIPLKEGGFCIDTPGIKSFGIWDLKKDDIEKYFSEIHHFAKFCKFTNCSHVTEDKCAVKKAIQKNQISYLRFESYLNLIKSIEEKKHRR